MIHNKEENHITSCTCTARGWRREMQQTTSQLLIKCGQGQQKPSYRMRHMSWFHCWWSHSKAVYPLTAEHTRLLQLMCSTHHHRPRSSKDLTHRIPTFPCCLCRDMTGWSPSEATPQAAGCGSATVFSGPPIDTCLAQTIMLVVLGCR